MGQCFICGASSSRSPCYSCTNAEITRASNQQKALRLQEEANREMRKSQQQALRLQKEANQTAYVSPTQPDSDPAANCIGCLGAVVIAYFFLNWLKIDFKPREGIETSGNLQNKQNPAKLEGSMTNVTNTSSIKVDAAVSADQQSAPSVKPNELSWESYAGKIIQAEMTGFDGRYIQLKLPDAKLYNYPLEKLSAESRTQALNRAGLGDLRVAGFVRVRRIPEGETLNVREAAASNSAILTTLNWDAAEIPVIGSPERNGTDLWLPILAPMDGRPVLGWVHSSFVSEVSP